MFTFILQIRQMVDGHPEFYLFAVYSAVIWMLWSQGRAVAPLPPLHRHVHRHDECRRPRRGRATRPLPRRHRPHGRAAARRDHRRHQRRTQPGPRGGLRRVRPARPLDAHPDPRQAQRRQDRHRDVERRHHRARRLRHRLDAGTLDELVRSRSPTSPSAASPPASASSSPSARWITRWADWLENSRALYSMPAQSVLGQIGCLPGRTIAFRRDDPRCGSWTSS